MIAVVEMSQSSWLVGGVLPGIERQPADSGGSRPRIRDDVAHHSDLMSLGVPR
jgi:hypothetical protein